MNARAPAIVARWALLAMLCAAPSAYAVIACNASATDISTYYNPAGSTVVVSGTYTISCTRAGGDASTVSYTLEASNGLHPQGQNNRVQFSGSYYLYTLYKDASLASNQRWGTAPPNQRAFSGTLNFGAALSVNTNGPFYVEILAPQTVGPAGVYTDTVATTLTYDVTNTTSLGSFNLSISSITSCTLTVPAAITFSYTSFQGTAATPSANFVVNCTTGTPYTMALDNTGPITDDAVFLTYTLGLSAAGGTGAGIDQTYQINGNMAAGQSGTCAGVSCTNAAATNKTRSITVTY